ncbi:uncharacterized protein [Narcine bancroftii]|uniref:uncharacterized protein n=1 Tax=Narcine bancroftii TaxID=1343680 RepID=UPI0038313E32
MAAKKSSNWCEAEIRLLDHLSQESQESELTETVKDGPIFEWLSGVLSAHGHSCMVTKLKSLRKKFHAVVDHNRRSGSGRKEWQYFDQCHTIWGASCSATPLNVASALENPDSPELIPEGSQASTNSNGGGVMQVQEVQAATEDSAGMDLDAPKRGSAEFTIPGNGEVALSLQNTASGPRRKHQRLTKDQVLAKELQAMMTALDREDREGDRQRAEESLEQERALFADLREEEEAMHWSEVDRQVQSVTGLSASLQELSAAMDRQSSIFNRMVT